MTASADVRYAEHAGSHLAYRVRGEGPPIVWAPSQFIPMSAMDDDPSYERFLDGLARFGTVLTFDRLGVGLSDPLVGDPTVEDWAAQIESVILAAGFEDAFVVAHAMGGLAGVHLAAHRPHRVRGLVLAMAAGGGNAPGDVAIEDVVATARPSQPSDSFDFLAVLAPTRVDDGAFRSWWERAGRQGASPAVAQRLLALQFTADVTALQSSVTVPTLVIDRPQAQRAMPGALLGAAIAGARVVEVPGVDVLAWLPDSDAVLAEIEEHVTGERRQRQSTGRRLLTVLFADVVGSTPAAVRLGDGRWRDVLESYCRSMRVEISRCGGNEIATAGDGFVVTFDTASEAVRCAQRMHRAVADLALQLRVGIHCGEVEVRGPDIAGIAVHLAARVEPRAQPGETWVTSTVKEVLTGSDVRFVDRGEHELKGVPGRWQLWSVDDAQVTR